MHKDQRGIIHILITAVVAGIIGLLLLSSLPVLAATTSGIVNLSLQPSSVSTNQGDTFTVNVLMDTKTYQVTAVSLNLSFDPKILQGVSFQGSSAVPVVLSPGSFNSGTASIALGTNPGSPVTGVITIATLTFKALQATSTPSQLILASTTQVAAVGQTGDVTGSRGSATINVTGQTNPTSQPTSTPVLTTTPTPTSSPAIMGMLGGIVTGKVGAPLCLAKVTIQKQGANHIVYTNCLGEYRFFNLPTKNYRVTFSKNGYVSQSKLITITNNQTATLNVQLAPKK